MGSEDAWRPRICSIAGKAILQATSNLPDSPQGRWRRSGRGENEAKEVRLCCLAKPDLVRRISNPEESDESESVVPSSVPRFHLVLSWPSLCACTGHQGRSHE